MNSRNGSKLSTLQYSKRENVPKCLLHYLKTQAKPQQDLGRSEGVKEMTSTVPF